MLSLTQRSLAALLLGLAPACSGEADEATAAAPAVAPLGRPPVVLIVFDALHAGHISHLGYERETTPHLDRLAAEGVSFDTAFAPAPYTRASIPSILTGRRPDSHGVTNVNARLAEEELTFAERLGAVGYRTVAAVGNLNGSAKLGAAQGFEVFEELFRSVSGDDVWKVGDDKSLLRRPTADMFVEFTRQQVAAQNADQPLLLYLHILEPHAPYLMAEEYRSLWLDPEYDGYFAGGDVRSLMDAIEGKYDPDEEDLAAAIALYDANLRWADHNLGEVRSVLEAAGLWDPALVIVTSDHGEAFWQHGRWGHNDHLFDEQVNVPLVVKLPAGRGPRGLVRTDLVSNIDHVPSLCEWLDLPAHGEPMDGYSLAALVEFEDWSQPPGRELILRSNRPIAAVGLRTESHKTIYQRGPKPRWNDTERVRHYALTDDPGEQHDLYPERRAEVDRIVERLEAWGSEAMLRRNELGRGMSPDELRMLERLGYVDGGDAESEED